MPDFQSLPVHHHHKIERRRDESRWPPTATLIVSRAAPCRDRSPSAGRRRRDRADRRRVSINCSSHFAGAIWWPSQTPSPSPIRPTSGDRPGAGATRGGAWLAIVAVAHSVDSCTIGSNQTPSRSSGQLLAGPGVIRWPNRAPSTHAVVSPLPRAGSDDRAGEYITISDRERLPSHLAVPRIGISAASSRPTRCPSPC